MNSEANVASEAEYLKDTEVAELLRLSVHTVRIWRTRGDGPPFVKIGAAGAVRYRRDDVAAWLAERKRLVTDGNMAAKARQHAAAAQN